MAEIRIGTSENFLFCLKGSRFISHRKKLKDSEESLATLFSRVGELKEKL